MVVRIEHEGNTGGHTYRQEVDRGMAAIVVLERES